LPDAALDAALRPVLSAGLRLAVKPALDPRVPFAVQRAWTAASAFAATRVPREATVTAERLGGIDAERWLPPAARPDVAVLYVHGGAFCIGSPRANRVIGARLALAARAPVYVPTYRLAPEHPYPAALEDALAAYDALRGRGFASGNIAFAGDSAGAGLVLATLVALRGCGAPLPAAAVLFSPLVDLSLSGATMRIKAKEDPLLSRAWLARCSALYRGTLAPRDPRVSPLFASLEGLPPLGIHVGTREILLDDAARLDARARAAGVAVEYRRYDGLWHNFQLQAGVLPSAARSYDDAARFLERYWPQPTAF
jgi:acetyl esterase/lipase